MVKTSYEPCCYTSNRHVIHRRRAYRNWSLNAQTCAAQEKRIQELESERDQGSRILPSILSPVLSAQLTNLQGTLILAWTTPLLEFALMKVFVSMQAFVQMKLGSEYLSCLRHVFEREVVWWIHTHAFVTSSPLYSIYSMTHSRISRIKIFASKILVFFRSMGSVNLGLEMITDVDKSFGPENLDERC
jgi:hypothetical protein